MPDKLRSDLQASSFFCAEPMQHPLDAWKATFPQDSTEAVLAAQLAIMLKKIARNSSTQGNDPSTVFDEVVTTDGLPRNASGMATLICALKYLYGPFTPLGFMHPLFLKESKNASIDALLKAIKIYDDLLEKLDLTKEADQQKMDALAFLIAAAERHNYFFPKEPIEKHIFPAQLVGYVPIDLMRSSTEELQTLKDLQINIKTPDEIEKIAGVKPGESKVYAGIQDLNPDLVEKLTPAHFQVVLALQTHFSQLGCLTVDTDLMPIDRDTTLYTGQGQSIVETENSGMGTVPTYDYPYQSIAHLTELRTKKTAALDTEADQTGPSFQP